MIPESINRSGWSSFQKELGVFLTGEKPRRGGVTLDIPGSASPSDGGGRSRKGQKMHNYGNIQKSRIFEKLGVNLERNVIQGDSSINNSVINGRLTRAFIFKLITNTSALRIFKPKGGKRCVSMLEPNERGFNKEGEPGAFKESQWPNPIAGPVSNSDFWKALCQVSEDPKGKGPSASCPSDGSLGFQKFVSRERTMGKSSRDAGMVSVGAPGDSATNKWTETKRDASAMPPASITAQSSAGTNSEHSCRTNNNGFNSEVVSVSRGWRHQSNPRTTMKCKYYIGILGWFRIDSLLCPTWVTKWVLGLRRGKT